MAESTESAEYAYIRKNIIYSGINLREIPKDKIVMTCQSYDGIISKKNRKLILQVIEDIYSANYR